MENSLENSNQIIDKDDKNTVNLFVIQTNSSQENKIFSNSKRFNPDDYVSLVEIGKGNYSSIYLIEDKTTKLLYEMKIYMKIRVLRCMKRLSTVYKK